jgi:hypothetical protein
MDPINRAAAAKRRKGMLDSLAKTVPIKRIRKPHPTRIKKVPIRGRKFLLMPPYYR